VSCGVWVFDLCILACTYISAISIIDLTSEANLMLLGHYKHTPKHCLNQLSCHDLHKT
jgi:hypothetical protein